MGAESIDSRPLDSRLINRSSLTLRAIVLDLRYGGGNMISINCIGVEKEVAMSINACSELDWFVYNAPLDYVELVLCGDLESYLRRVSDPHSGVKGNL